MKVKKLIKVGVLTCMMSIQIVFASFAHAADEVEILGATSEQETVIRNTLKKYIPEYKIAEFNREEDLAVFKGEGIAGKIKVVGPLGVNSNSPDKDEKVWEFGRGIEISSKFVNEEYVLRGFFDYLRGRCGQWTPKPVSAIAKKYSDGKRETYTDYTLPGNVAKSDGGKTSGWFYDAYIAWKFNTAQIDTELREYFEWLEKDYTVADEYGRILKKMSAQDGLYVTYYRDTTWRWGTKGEHRYFVGYNYTEYPGGLKLGMGGPSIEQNHFIAFNEELQKPVLYRVNRDYNSELFAMVVSEEVFDDRVGFSGIASVKLGHDMGNYN